MEIRIISADNNLINLAEFISCQFNNMFAPDNILIYLLQCRAKVDFRVVFPIIYFSPKLIFSIKKYFFQLNGFFPRVFTLLMNSWRKKLTAQKKISFFLLVFCEKKHIYI